ncbi:phage tail spike protein [Enterococcus hirae]|uniref:phage tail spike protein n=1 Tax=Enterococcus hirae TaxID=1354 RepID=UPI000F6D696A|nr:phage tail spike protein [Enterococcus hirae]VEE82042.1 phage minor structural protein N-terminal domain protein [Enterococcus hirae]
MTFPILYPSDANAFSNLGEGPLSHALSCTVTEERNGVFMLEMVYPVEGQAFSLLKTDKLIKADAGHKLKKQRFRIKKMTKPIDGKVTVYAEHISYRSKYMALKPSVTVAGDGFAALNAWNKNLTEPSPFTVVSDVLTYGRTIWKVTEVENPRQALGGVKGSILDVWGGEYEFDNYTISLLKQRGTTANTLLAYGRNITDFVQEEEILSTYTTIYPYATYQDDNQNEVILTLPELTLDCDNAGNFPERVIQKIDFSSDFEDKEIPTIEKLRTKAIAYMKSNEYGIPKVSIRLSFIDLSKTVDYQEYGELEQLNLCDIVPVRFEKLGVNTKAKVTRTVWNVLTDSYDEIEIGEKRTNLTSTIQSTINTSVEKVEKQISIVQTTADGKNKIFRQSAEPIAENVNDQWWKPDGEDTEIYFWDGSVWAFAFSTKTGREASNKADQAQQEAEQAKEDALQANINALQAIQQIDFLGGRLDQVENIAADTLDQFNQNKQEVQAQLSTQGGLIQGLVTKTDGQTVDIANLQLQNEGLSSTVAKVQADQLNYESRNYVPNSKGDSLEGYAAYRGATLTTDGSLIKVSKKSSETKNYGIQTKSFQVEGGKTYTLSLDVGSYYRTSSLDYSFLIYQDGAGNQKLPAIPVSTVSTELTRQTIAFTPTRSGSVQLMVGVNLTTQPDSTGFRVAKIKVGLGETIHTPWNPAIEDYTTVLAFSSLEQRVDGFQLVVDNKADRTEVTQLANQYTILLSTVEGHTSQLSVLEEGIQLFAKKDELISLINVSPESILISGAKVQITGETYIENGVIKSAMIESLVADKINVGTLNGADVNIININVENLVGNISSFVNSYWNGISQDVKINSSGLILYENGERAFQLHRKGVTAYGEVNGVIQALGTLGRNFEADTPAISFNVERGAYMNIMYRGDGSTSFQKSFSLSGTTGGISIHSPMTMHADINVKGNKITGIKTIEGNTLFQGVQDLRITSDVNFRLSKMGQYGGLNSRYIEIFEKADFSDGSHGVGFRLWNGKAAILLCSGGQIRVKNASGSWVDLKI